MSQLMSVRKIAAAVRLMDGFTGQAADSTGLRVKMDDGALPVRKPEGYCIFWDNGRNKRALVVEGAGYEREELLLDIEALSQKGLPTCCIWLKPGRDYAYPGALKRKERMEEPGKEVTLPLEASAGGIRLAEDYPMDQPDPSAIRLQVPDELELENRKLCIRPMNGEEEYFTIWSVMDRGMGLYKLEHPLKGRYGPYEAEILLTLVLRADSRGRLIVPADC